MNKCIFCDSKLKKTKKVDKFYFVYCENCWMTYPFSESKEEAWKNAEKLYKIKETLEIYSNKDNWKNIQGSNLFVCEIEEKLDDGEYARKILYE